MNSVFFVKNVIFILSLIFNQSLRVLIFENYYIMIYIKVVINLKHGPMNATFVYTFTFVYFYLKPFLKTKIASNYFIIEKIN